MPRPLVNALAAAALLATLLLLQRQEFSPGTSFATLLAVILPTLVLLPVNALTRSTPWQTYPAAMFALLGLPWFAQGIGEGLMIAFGAFAYIAAATPLQGRL